ncbi:MAG: NifB/NifX family molybdenum-iron cluster-binding protein [Deltaproteobacteria bacterium]|jgi:predicted Fe-Mo cluster-binding NifX family protein
MTTVAIPAYRSRIAPVFDFSDCVLLINLENNREVERTVLHLKALPPSDRVSALARGGVRILICAGISDLLKTMLESSGIHVVGGIVGGVEDVLAAFIRNRLNEPQFSMPGLKQGHIHPGEMPESMLEDRGTTSRNRK